MCLEPLVLAGWLWTMQYNHFHGSNKDGAVIEAQTCERGAGLNWKSTTSGLHALAAQYGLSTDLDGWIFTATPQLGGAYLDARVPELSGQLNFSLGLSLAAGREQWRLALTYWHMSNAGIGRDNAGLDLIGLQAGWLF